jgi:flagellar biosynthesis anti-sigma factor FlgM
MRIDQKVVTPGAASLESAERADADRRTGKTGYSGRATGDSVQVSSDAQLLNQALRAASSLPSIRADKVEMARQKLASGGLGADAGALADRLIDSLIVR